MLTTASWPPPPRFHGSCSSCPLLSLFPYSASGRAHGLHSLRATATTGRSARVRTFSVNPSPVQGQSCQSAVHCTPMVEAPPGHGGKHHPHQCHSGHLRRHAACNAPQSLSQGKAPSPGRHLPAMAVAIRTLKDAKKRAIGTSTGSRSTWPGLPAHSCISFAQRQRPEYGCSFISC